MEAVLARKACAQQEEVPYIMRVENEIKSWVHRLKPNNGHSICTSNEKSICVSLDNLITRRIVKEFNFTTCGRAGSSKSRRGWLELVEAEAGVGPRTTARERVHECGGPGQRRGNRVMSVWGLGAAATR
jgi:hypothetical protein